MKKITTVVLMASAIVLFAAGTFAQTSEDTRWQRDTRYQRNMRGQRGFMRNKGMMGQRGRRGQQGFMQNRGMMGQGQGRLLVLLTARQDELKITDAQLEKIKTLTLKMQEDMIQHQNDMNILRFELKKLMLDRENRDYEKIEAKMRKTSDMRQDMFIQRMKDRDEILNILTPEQQDALKAEYGNFINQRQSYRNRFPRRFNR